MLRASCFAVATLVLTACGDDTGTGAFAGSPPSSGGSGGSGGTAGAPVVGGAGGAEVGGSGSGGAVEGGGGETQGGAGGEGEGGMGGNPPVCDSDGDKQPVAGPGCCGAPSVCDCDDDDLNVFPGQGTYFEEPRPFENDPILQWDYDCNGVADKQYVQASGPCGLLDCVGTTTKFLGNNGDYFCGAPGTLQICNGLGLQCTLQGGVTLACK